jgi:hypothetical protein
LDTPKRLVLKISKDERGTIIRLEDGTFKNVKAKNQKMFGNPIQNPIVCAVADNDPQFGRTSTDEGDCYTSIKSQLLACKFTCPDNGIADSITIYVKGSDFTADKIKCALYTNGSPPTLLGQTEERDQTWGSSFAWQTFNFTGNKPALVTNTVYWIVAWATENALQCRIGCAFNMGFEQTWIDANYPYTGTFPSTLSWDSKPDEEHCMYCSYSTGGTTTYEITKSSDARIKVTKQTTKNSDAKAVSEYYSDATIASATGTREIQKTSNARVKTTVTSPTKTSDARVKTTVTSPTKLSDARVRKIVETSKTSDAKIQSAGVTTHVITKYSDATVISTVTKMVQKMSDADIFAVQTLSRFSSSRIKMTAVLPAKSSDSRVKKTQTVSPSLLSDAKIETGAGESFSVEISCFSQINTAIEDLSQINVTMEEIAT